MVCAVRLTVNVDCWGPSSDCSAAPRGQVLKQDIKDEELFHKLSPQTAGLFSCSQGFHTVKYYNNIDTVPELQMYWVKLGNWKEVSEYSDDDFFKMWIYSKFVKRLRTKKKENVKILLYSFIITIINWTLTLGLSLMELLLDLSHSLFRFSQIPNLFTIPLFWYFFSLLLFFSFLSLCAYLLFSHLFTAAQSLTALFHSCPTVSLCPPGGLSHRGRHSKRRFRLWICRGHIDV